MLTALLKKLLGNIPRRGNYHHHWYYFKLCPLDDACHTTRLYSHVDSRGINLYKVTPMNMEQLEGKWDQVKGQVKQKWGKLTDNDITVIHGKKDQLLGKIREYYGHTKEEAERQLDAFVKNCK